MTILYSTSGTPTPVWRTDGTLVWGGTPPTPEPPPEPTPELLIVPTYTGPTEDRTGVTTLTTPYNSPNTLNLPAHPGYDPGYGTHPSVVDMQAETGQAWQGYRYWMAWTPYQSGDTKAENPCIAVSNDKTTWITPPFASNPIDPWPGGDTYNSDTDLRWDPERSRLWCWWRRSVNLESGEQIVCAWTDDGITWSAPIEVVTSNAATALLSPTVVRVAADHWRMFYIGDRGHPSGVRSASRPEGPWSDHADITISTNGATVTPWHIYVFYEYGEFRAVINAYDGAHTWRLYAGTSVDGINFSTAIPSAVQWPRVEAWESQHYRSCVVPADNGIDYEVWYADWGSGWRIAHTQWPKQHWWDLTPPAI